MFRGATGGRMSRKIGTHGRPNVITRPHAKTRLASHRYKQRTDKSVYLTTATYLAYSLCPNTASSRYSSRLLD